MTTHSIFAPSSAERAIPCPASVTMEARYPEAEKTPEAIEGEAAHWVVQQMLQGVTPSEGDPTPNGSFVTQEMLEGADLMVEDVEIELEPFGMVPSSGAIEVPVHIPRAHAQCFGTPDYRNWLPTSPRPTLLLYDYKFGHRHVEVCENPQMVDYVSGCMSATNLQDSQIDVVVKIVQPRSFHRDGPVRAWRFNGADIRAHINRRAMAADLALRPDPPAQSGPHCRDCKARHACEAFTRSVYAAMDYAGKAVPMELSPAAMGVELVMIDEAIKRLEARKTGVQQQVESVMRRGAHVPHWSFEAGKGRERWKMPDAQVIALGQAMGFDVAQPPKALTPKQAVDKGFPLHAMPGMTETPKTALTLVRDDGSKARRVFGG